jgi:hypothetical protein
VAHRVDRFSRSPRDTFEAIERLHAAGARLVGVADGVDSGAPSGELVFTVLAGLAREQWKQRRDNWAEATGRAVADGVHISSRPPTGYVRENGKRSRLVPDPKVAPLVRECFLRRAQGASWQQLADYMEENGARVSKTGVGHMLRNRVYLGEAGGAKKGESNPGAHKPLVSVQEWEAVQGQGKTHAKNGTIAAQGLLSGLITCAACGHKLSVTGSGKRVNGTRAASYFCKGRFASGRCPAPASGRVTKVDGFVGPALSQALVDGTLRTTMDAIARYNDAVEAVEKAQRDLDALADNRLLAALGREGLTAMAEDQRAVLEAAKQELRNTPTPDDAIEPTADLWDPETWPIEKLRQLARQFIAEVTLTRGGKGRWSLPAHERVSIRWAGHEEPDTTIYERMKNSESHVLDHLIEPRPTY